MTKTEPTTEDQPIEPIEKVEERLAALGFSSVFDDHGLSWTRKAGKEWARLSAHTLMVLPAMEPTADAPWSWFIVADADTETIVARGPAPTRPHARQAAVLALGDLLTPPKPVDVATMMREPGPSPRQRVAAGVILAVILVMFVVAIVAAVVR